jgi:hypothetical protein
MVNVDNQMEVSLLSAVATGSYLPSIAQYQATFVKMLSTTGDDSSESVKMLSTMGDSSESAQRLLTCQTLLLVEGHSHRSIEETYTAGMDIGAKNIYNLKTIWNQK